MATKKVNTTLKNKFEGRLEDVKEITKVANDFVLDTAEDVLDKGFKNGAKWQEIGEKSLQGGLKLAATQQDLFFDSLDMLKSQFQVGKSRFSSLFSKN